MKGNQRDSGVQTNENNRGVGQYTMAIHLVWILIGMVIAGALFVLIAQYPLLGLH